MVQDVYEGGGETGGLYYPACPGVEPSLLSQEHLSDHHILMISSYLSEIMA